MTRASFRKGQRPDISDRMVVQLLVDSAETFKAMTLPKKIGTFVLGLAVAIGTVGKYSPHLFMRLPFPLSIILWDVTGHEMPP